MYQHSINCCNYSFLNAIIGFLDAALYDCILTDNTTVIIVNIGIIINQKYVILILSEKF